jgi:hypothetical protein
MTKFLPGQKVKLIEKITEGSYTYEVRHECAVILIYDDFSTEYEIASGKKEIRYLIDSLVFDEEIQDYNPPFGATESQLENNEDLSKFNLRNY